jgi:hypothetical protein
MASLDMDGPYALTVDEINRKVKMTGPGNFALGHMTRDKKFVVRFVGRDDADIRQALLGSVGRESKRSLFGRILGQEMENDSFKFSYAQDADAAYEKHCRSYHGFNSNNQLKNDRHPKPPKGSGLKCPVCGEV